MNRIVVIGDSLSLPRKTEDEFIQLEHTWSYILNEELSKKDKHFEVINCGARSRTITSLLGHDFVEHIVFKEPDIIILQIGIVDAAPRVITKREKRIFNHRLFPSFLRNRIISSRKKNKFIKTSMAPLSKVYTPPKEFKEALHKFSSRIKNNYHKPLNKLIVIPIVANIPFMTKESPKYGENVNLYNAILKEFTQQYHAEFLKIPNSFTNDKINFCKDGYHLSHEGNQIISSLILEVI